METKFVKAPFDIEMAKKITNGEVEGKIVTREGNSVRILCWDKKDKTYTIAALVDNGSEEDFKSYTNEGIWNTDKTCTLKKYNLMLEIPEYMTFKDGDILTYRKNENRWSIFVYKNRDSDVLANYVEYDCDSRGNNIIKFERSFYNSNFCKKATEEERQKLIDALKSSKEPKAKEYLKRFFGIEVKPGCEFKPKDWVLGRDDDEEWGLDIFSHTKINGEFACVGAIWKQIIPYNEKTAHLLGTTEDYKGD